VRDSGNGREMQRRDEGFEAGRMSLARIYSAKEQVMASAHVWYEVDEPVLARPPDFKCGQMMVIVPSREWSLLVLAIDDAWASNQDDAPASSQDG
jgi:hypothetical protein